ncbi:MAG: hypothetical protein CME62_07930 [Halobacteriovoraceae bacterium]|nr:hypothetical protein [Halobacteriovoraceae bacterium]
MNIYIFPGNPPARYYYKKWSQELAPHFPDWSFKVLTYTQDMPINAPLDLKAVEKNLDHQIKPDQTTPLFFISHSLGSYFAFKMSQKVKNNFKGHLCIFPFIGGASLSAQLQLKMLYSIQRNSFIKQGFHNFIHHLSLVIPEIKNITPKEMNAALDLAKNEWELLRTRDLQLPCANPNQFLVFNPQDRWCPKKTIQYLREYMPAVMTDCSHDFIRFQSQRDSMSKIFIQYCSSL